jgi:hypothetical protein
MKQPYSLLCGLIIFLSLAACTAIGPRATEVPTVEEPMCITGCVDSLWIRLDGAVPQEFELRLAKGYGIIGRVRCVDGQAIECWEGGMHGCAMLGCLVKGVRYFRKLNSFDVTVTWDGNQIVEHIEPNYEEFSVCGNVCYGADVTISLPESP